MNREAVALGTPVYTVFEGPARSGRRAPDRRGAAAPTASAAEVNPVKRDGEAASAARIRRDPGLLVDLLLSARGSKLG